ncbi:MAG: ATP-binding protein [Treponema sp.]|nr:ATP-binding protein [Treponema sp.]
MILEIRLENFYSIKDEILLDFRAAKMNNERTKALSENLIDYNGQKILKSIGLYGANASGKSNIIKAISKCSEIILQSHLNNEGDMFNFTSFKFDNYPNKPSSFSIDFIHENKEYEYSFSLTPTEILKESLYFYPNGRRAKVFTRDETKGGNKQKIYNFSDGIIPRPFDIATNTSKKTLFLSRASQMDRDFCKKIYRFFMGYFWHQFAPLNFKHLNLDETMKSFNQDKALILHALSICDNDITDINMILNERKIPDMKGSYINIDPDINSLMFETFHRASPSIPFDMFREESAGTKQLFHMLFFILRVVREGKTLMIDEFDLSLHTKIAEFIIDLFHASLSSQFLFTTHNTKLIDIKRFRRDQIIFVNKKDDGSTELYSLFDHKDFRENMDAEKGYLQGRFDAVPIVNTELASLKKLLMIN